MSEPDTRHEPLNIFVVAGEPSGDNLGGRIMAALRELSAVPVLFSGVGGERMSEQGLTSLFPMSEIALFGMAEIIPHIPNVFRRIFQTAGAVRRLRPDVVLTIDSPAFSFGVAKRVQGLGIPLVHLNAPKVWAYRPGRAKRVARYYDHLLALLPFEPPYFEAVGLPTTFIGHPAIEAGLENGDRAGFRAHHRIPREALVLCVLPGSRASEINQLLGIFSETVKTLSAVFPGMHVVLPTVPNVASKVADIGRTWPVPTTIIEDAGEKADAFAASDVVLAASGTVTVELAMAEVPMVVAYRASALTAAIFLRLVRVRFASIVNLVCDRPVIPELIQDECRSDRLHAAVSRRISARGDNN